MICSTEREFPFAIFPHEMVDLSGEAPFLKVQGYMHGSVVCCLMYISANYCE